MVSRRFLKGGRDIASPSDGQLSDKPADQVLLQIQLPNHLNEGNGSTSPNRTGCSEILKIAELCTWHATDYRLTEYVLRTCTSYLAL